MVEQEAKVAERDRVFWAEGSNAVLASRRGVVAPGVGLFVVAEVHDSSDLASTRGPSALSLASLLDYSLGLVRPDFRLRSCVDR